MPLTATQLKTAANDAFYLVGQLFAYYSWSKKIKPLIPANMEMSNVLVENAVIEAQLMFYRKLNEFFRPINPAYPDDLKSSLFGYSATGGFLSPEEIRVLHKRVAHPTTAHAENGELAYEMYAFSYDGLQHSIPFLQHLATNFHPSGSDESESLTGAIGTLRLKWSHWSEGAEPEKRRALTV